MNKLSWTVAAALLSAAVAASAAADTGGTDGAGDAGAIYEWVDDGGRMHASDTVPDKYKSVAKRIDPNRARLPAGEQEEAERQAAALKAKAASAVPLSQTAGMATRPGAARTGNLSGSLPGSDTPECAAWRRQIAANSECFIASTNRRGHGGGLHSCSNEPDPPRPQTCGPDDSR
jgi:hypothetical protein